MPRPAKFTPEERRQRKNAVNRKRRQNFTPEQKAKESARTKLNSTLRYENDPDYRERRKRDSAQWKKDNPDKVKITLARSREKPRKSKLHWARRVLSGIKRRSSDNGLPFNLTAEDIVAAFPIDDICPITGLTMKLGGKRFGKDTPSVDRLIPKLGYVKGNIAVISAWANTIKSDCIDPIVFENIASYIRRMSEQARTPHEDYEFLLG